MAARTSAAVGLCLLVGLAGCSGLVADQPTTEPATTTSTQIDEPTATHGAVSIQVTGNGTYTLTVVAVAEGTDGVRIRYANGSTATYADVQSRGDLPGGALDGASSIEPVSEGSSVSFRTSNGSGGTFDWRAEPTAVVYSVVDENGRLLGWNYFDCGNGTLLEVRVDVSENGTVSDGRGCAT